MESINDYCRHQLLAVGPSRDLKKFDRTLALPGATDVALLEHSPEWVVWQFVMDKPELPFLRGLSRRWSRLTFILLYDCEDHHVTGFVGQETDAASSSVIRHPPTWAGAHFCASGPKHFKHMNPSTEATPRPKPVVRKLKVEAAGDFWKGFLKPKIRLMGHWLHQAGFRSGNHVYVRCVSPGVLELRSTDASPANHTQNHEDKQTKQRNHVILPRRPF